jgi:glycerol kinase
MDLVVRPEALRGGELAALGLTNQRETTVVWDRRTGAPLCNAVVWQDVRSQQAVDEFRRSGDVRRVRDVTGLPVSTYFSAFEIDWILRNVPNARAAAEDGDALFGTIDTWLLWNLTGGASGGYTGRT